ncbi:unnamed protein product [Chondrus crispus]|uniref:Uncharacterized protein n=1 Tax=Chondrus crispus TaxID=2769 RepID=R7QDB7_CHOCR|nr:unnamed protein product [Chondrus crispus]CDF36059.1 unnamed protein product [Chondrus crispus]|eukprot:XP_005715878.1 unnamed protein product [Chondrus crispus]
MLVCGTGELKPSCSSLLNRAQGNLFDTFALRRIINTPCPWPPRPSGGIGRSTQLFHVAQNFRNFDRSADHPCSEGSLHCILTNLPNSTPSPPPKPYRPSVSSVPRCSRLPLSPRWGPPTSRSAPSALTLAARTVWPSRLQRLLPTPPSVQTSRPLQSRCRTWARQSASSRLFSPPAQIFLTVPSLVPSLALSRASGPRVRCAAPLPRLRTTDAHGARSRACMQVCRRRQRSSGIGRTSSIQLSVRVEVAPPSRQSQGPGLPRRGA